MAIVQGVTMVGVQGAAMSGVQGAETLSAPVLRAGAVAGPAGLRIGLVNNMRGAGFRDSDRQFRAMIEAAAVDATVIGYRMIDTAADPRGTAYRSLAALADDAPDALIVTGAEPGTAELRDEAFYPALTRLIDYAIERRLPVMFSCLAAHVAVLHLSGVRRRRLARKCHGVFRFAPAGGGEPAAARLIVPHSRWNALDHAALTARGYRVLAASGRAGVDRFVHDDAPGWMFLQGHPEYEATSLLGEYRRDLRRYQTGEAASRPTMPVGCFDAAGRAALRAAAASGLAMPTPRPGCATPAWRQDAIRLYRGWLGQAEPAELTAA